MNEPSSYGAELTALAVRAKASGEPDDVAALIVASARAARYVSRPLRQCGVEQEDRGQLEVVAVLESLRTFDPGLGYQFTTALRAWGRGVVMKYLETDRFTISLSDYALKKLRRDGRAPRRLGLTDAVAGRAYASDPDVVADADEREWLHAMLSRLSEREAEVIRRRYLSPEPETLRAIAECWGLTFQRVQQIEEAALGRLQRLAKKGA